jgi:hypothetical protein
MPFIAEHRDRLMRLFGARVVGDYATAAVAEKAVDLALRGWRVPGSSRVA